jgi:hypothetical protein
MREFRFTEDIYSFANELIVEAKAHGDVNSIKLLQNAIDRGGLLPSERLGELRLAFEELNRAINKDYLILLRSDIKAAIRSINMAFKRSNRLW